MVRISAAALISFSLAFLVASAAYGTVNTSLLSGPDPVGHPPRVAFVKLDPDRDWTKPLASQEGAGYVMNSDVLIGQVGDGWVVGRNLKTGGEEWWLKAPATMTAPPGSFGSAVVLGFRDGSLLKIDALTGKVAWRANLESFTERDLVLQGNSLYVVTAAQVLYAIDFQSGKTLWLYDGGFPENLAIRAGAPPVFYDQNVVFGTDKGELLAVNGSSGKLVWRYNPSYSDTRFHLPVGQMAVRKDQLVLARYDGLVAAVSLRTGDRRVIWQEKLPTISTANFRGGRFFVGTVNGEVHALDIDDGRRLWRYASGETITTVTVGDSYLYATGSDGRVTALNVTNGEEEWFDDLGGSIDSQPILYDKGIYFLTGLRALYGYRLQ